MTHRFTLTFAGIDFMEDDLAEKLYEAGLDDGTPFSTRGVAGVGVAREAASLEAAIASAVADARKAGVAVATIEIDPADVPAVAA